jgi:adenine phosphoribosyltransferase
VDLLRYIREVPDFPRPGILFKDITTLLKEPAALDAAVRQLADPYRNAGVSLVAGIESRGFILGAAVARDLGAGFVPIRKSGKLPAKTASASYVLEYGTDSIEIHTDAIAPGQRVLLLDDLLATGGTMEAAVKLVKGLGGQVLGIAFLIELTALDGRSKLHGESVMALVAY